MRAGNPGSLFTRAVVFLDEILRGTKLADLALERSTKFDFIINLKTAKQIGLTIPPNVLPRANKVIKSAVIGGQKSAVSRTSKKKFMNRKICCLGLCALFLALSFPAATQQSKKVPRIGYLHYRSSY